jgi:hypothetical protein
MYYYADRKEKKDSYKPPAGVQAEARRALEWIKGGNAGEGFTDVGRKRASDLAAGRAVSLKTIKRMHSYLSRHGVDKQGEGWSKGSKGYPSPGRVAWAAWGGDAAKSWVNGILGESDIKESKKEAALKPGLDDWWETDPDEADMQQGQPSANWFENWNVTPTYINDEIGRDIEHDTGRGPAGIGDFDQAWRIFNTPDRKHEQIVQIEKHRRKFPDHFTINEISGLLGVTREAIQARIKNGKFPKADIAGTTGFKGDKGNLPALWHRDTIKDLVPLPDKPKENVKQKTIKVNAAKEGRKMTQYYDDHVAKKFKNSKNGMMNNVRSF